MRIGSLAGSALFLAFAACADMTPQSPSASHDVTVSIPGVPGLRQTIRVEPAEPVTGGNFWVSSVLRNEGTTATPTIAVSICGVSTRGTFEFVDPSLHCAGYSMTTSIAPGDSVVDGRGGVVTSGAGTWRLEVQQLRQPATWTGVDVTVH
jgi:hypothetical protein